MTGIVIVWSREETVGREEPGDRKEPARRASGFKRMRLPIAVVILAAAGLAVFVWRTKAPKPAPPMPAPVVSGSGRGGSAGFPGGSLPGGSLPGGSLLDQVVPKSEGPANVDLSGPVATTEQLQKQFATLADYQEQINELKVRATAAAEAKNADLVKTTSEEGKRLVSLVDLLLRALQADLAAARQAKPQDPTVQWLTGELLLTAGGEPEEIRPYFERAVAAGLKQPQLFASLAKVEFDSNHFQAAYEDARKALAADNHKRAVWEIYARASFGVERFHDVVEGLDQAFPKDKPAWAADPRKKAQHLVEEWKRELALRQAEDKADDLPRVRFTIEHRAFVNGSAGEKSTGRGDVELELFEDQAPATVANFLYLVERRFYDGTRFHWAEAGRMAVGGDPNTKLENRSEDGNGGPGYSIPDESRSALARGHFRGSISLVQHGPRTAGSQFFITLVPCPEFDGRFTTFGRVIAGQEVMDQVTEGRTNREIGEFGKIIPGDVLVHAEVIRKRAHKYEVTKIAP